MAEIIFLATAGDSDVDLRGEQRLMMSLDPKFTL